MKILLPILGIALLVAAIGASATMYAIVGFAAVFCFFLLIKALAGSGTTPPNGMRVAKTFHKQVHGLFHKNADGTSRQKIIRDCSIGEELELILEPDNRFDPDAIKVCRRLTGEQIGYWPAEDDMAKQLRGGWVFRVTIDEIYSMPENDRRQGTIMYFTKEPQGGNV